MSEIRTDTINNASGDNDSGIDLSTNDQVSIKTANTTAVTVDSSQNVGIGTSSPLSNFDVAVEASDTRRFLVNYDDNILTVKGSNQNSNPEALRIVADNFRVSTGTTGSGSEALRIDNSGDLLVGKTSDDNSAGISLRNTGEGYFVRDGANSLALNRLSSNGDIISFFKDTSSVGAIGTGNGSDVFNIEGSSNYLQIGAGDTGVRFYSSLNAIYPVNVASNSNRDNAIDLGISSVRFDDIYATNGNIQTSDRNEKQDIEQLSDAEQRVAVVAKGLMRKFRWIDSVAEKGDNARTHFGIIAQDLQDAFTAEGLDAGDYAMFCSNTWWEKEISVDAVEADEENGIEAKDAYTYIDTKEEATEGYTERTRLGVRYNQLLAFIISAL